MRIVKDPLYTASRCKLATLQRRDPEKDPEVVTDDTTESDDALPEEEE